MTTAITSDKNLIAAIRGITESRALHLLGTGLGPEVVASAVGVSVSRISQLMSDADFASEVATLRFESLQKHNIRDNSYDEMEDSLMGILKNVLPLMHRPMEVLKAISVINAAKRRGSSAPEQITHQNTVINLTIPNVLIQKYTTNINNQVITAGEQVLETVQSHTLLDSARKKSVTALIPAPENSSIVPARSISNEQQSTNESSSTVLTG